MMTENELAINGGEPAVTQDRPHFEWPEIDEELQRRIDDYVGDRPLSIDGKEGIYAELEEEFAAYHDADHALTTNSGTTALHEAYFACGLEPGDEVIAPVYTFLATVTPIFHNNAVPVLADVEPDYGTISPESIRQNITERTEAIVVTHIWGHPAEMDEILEIAEEHDLSVIEDCSHAHGAEYKGQKVGTLGDVGAFSLQGKKMVQGGEAGVLITDDDEKYQRALMLGHYRNRTQAEVDTEPHARFNETGYGLKFRMHPLAGVIANYELERLEERISLRNECLEYFTEQLESTSLVEPPKTKSHVHRGAYYGYKPRIRTDKFPGLSLDQVIEAMAAEGLKAKRPGSRPLNTYALFQEKPVGFTTYSPQRERPLYEEGDFPVAEEHYGKMVSMPPFLTEDKTIIDDYVKAFEKIEENIEAVKEL